MSEEIIVEPSHAERAAASAAGKVNMRGTCHACGAPDRVLNRIFMKSGKEDVPVDVCVAWRACISGIQVRKS